MKNRSLFLMLAALLMVGADASAQKIKAGKGAGKLVLGMSVNDLTNMLGRPELTSTLDEETEAYIASGYQVEKELPFLIGFDKVLQFSNESDSKMALPVFKAFFNEDKLVYVIFTSYGFPGAIFNKVKMKKGVAFMTEVSKLEKGFGKGFVSSRESDAEYQLDYLKKGVNFAIDEDKIRAIHIYAPLTDAQITAYKSKL